MLACPDPCQEELIISQSGRHHCFLCFMLSTDGIYEHWRHHVLVGDMVVVGGTGRTVESPFQRDDLTLSAVQEEGVFIHKVDPFTNTHMHSHWDATGTIQPIRQYSGEVTAGRRGSSSSFKKNSTKDEYLLPSISWPGLNCCSTGSGGKTSCSQTDTVTCLTEGSIGQKYDKIRRSPPTDCSPPESPGPRKPPYGI